MEQAQIIAEVSGDAGFVVELSRLSTEKILALFKKNRVEVSCFELKKHMSFDMGELGIKTLLCSVTFE